MAIKIIKQGVINTYEAVCPVCGCEFEFDTTDAGWYRRVNTTNANAIGIVDVETTLHCSIQCPTCRISINRESKHFHKRL